MNPTLTEIVRYCREENTFGALLLCGEWGSGKTHLLDVDLPAALGDAYVILRVSLFGEESLDGIRRKVQQAYADRQRDLCPVSPVRTDDGNPAFLYENVRPAPKIAGRCLILAFDDLERTRLAQAELLGCINEYCENLHIKTIVVANEEKIESRSASESGSAGSRKKEYLGYSEMKEKLIERTVRLQMNDAEVIRNIIAQYRSENEEYLLFLQENRESLISLLRDCELHNIRSLRCGLQDFERVCLWCRQEGIPEEDIRRYFSSFVLFTMLAKNGRISKSTLYGYGLNKLQQKYRGHYHERCMPDCLKDSIMTGDWDESRIRKQLRMARDFQQSLKKPENRLRAINLPELDDDTVNEGWLPYLSLAFEGELAPEEYIRLLRHLLTARKYGSALPSPVDMKRLTTGLERSFERICCAGEAPGRSVDPLEEEELRECNDAERSFYRKILRCLDTRELQLRHSRSQLLDACRNGDEDALARCRRCVVRRFDSELVQAVIDCYASLENNRSRIAFAELIGKIYANSRKSLSLEEDEPARSGKTKDDIPKLIRFLRETVRQETEAGHPMASLAAAYFAELLEKPRR